MDKIGIYMRSGTQESVPIKLEKYHNKVEEMYAEDALKNTVSYIDIAASSFYTQNSLHNLVDDIKKNNINIIYVENIYSFSRQFERAKEIIDLCFENNCKIFTLDNNKFLEEKDVEFVANINNMLARNLRNSIRHSNFNMEMSTRTIIQGDNKTKIRRTIGKISPMLNFEEKYDKEYDKNYDNVFWFGGEVATFKASDGEYKIIARGIVDCDLIAKKDFTGLNGNSYKKGDIIASVKDKSESGLLKKEMQPFIKGDLELSEILDDESEILELKIDNNNWFELEYYNNLGEVVFDDYVLESNSFSKAIEEVKDMLWEKFKNSKRYAIYTRINQHLDSLDENIGNQSNICLNALNEKIKGDKDIINHYSDFCSTTENMSFGALSELISDIKEGKIKGVVARNLSRINRNMDNTIRLVEVLNSQNCDVYLVDENQYLCKDIFNNIPASKLLSEMSKYFIENEKEEDFDEIEYE